MTAFSFVMLGKLVFFVAVVSLRLNPVSFLFFLFFFFFHLLCQMSTRCLSAKALSFWREERRTP